MTELPTAFDVSIMSVGTDGYRSKLLSEIAQAESRAWEEIERRRDILGFDREEEFQIERRFILAKFEIEVFHMRMEEALIRKRILSLELLRPISFKIEAPK